MINCPRTAQHQIGNHFSSTESLENRAKVIVVISQISGKKLKELEPIKAFSLIDVNLEELGQSYLLQFSFKNKMDSLTTHKYAKVILAKVYT